MKAIHSDIVDYELPGDEGGVFVLIGHMLWISGFTSGLCSETSPQGLWDHKGFVEATRVD